MPLLWGNISLDNSCTKHSGQCWPPPSLRAVSAGRGRRSPPPRRPPPPGWHAVLVSFAQPACVYREWRVFPTHRGAAGAVRRSYVMASVVWRNDLGRGPASLRHGAEGASIARPKSMPATWRTTHLGHPPWPTPFAGHTRIAGRGGGGRGTNALGLEIISVVRWISFLD